MSDLISPVSCPFCTNEDLALIDETDDGLFWICGVCSRVWGKDRPVLNESDRKMLKARGIEAGHKDKPWGTY